MYVCIYVCVSACGLHMIQPYTRLTREPGSAHPHQGYKLELELLFQHACIHNELQVLISSTGFLARITWLYMTQLGCCCCWGGVYCTWRGQLHS